MGVDEARRLIGESEQRQMFKDHQFGQRYNYFNQFQNKVSESYNQNVIIPEMEKKYKIDSMIKKHEIDKIKRDNAEAINKENAKKNWNMNNRMLVEGQIKDKQSGKLVGATEHEVDFNNRVQHEKNVNDVEFFEKFKKKQEQSSYKEELDNQLKISKQRKLYGNMTGVEKSFNKDDLVAWKHYNQNTFALIPGLNSSKKPIPDKILIDKQLHKRERSYEDEFHRLNQFGLTRDVKLAKNPEYTSHYVNSSRRHIEGNSLSVEPQREQFENRKFGTAAHNIDTNSEIRNAYQNNGGQKVLSSEVPKRNMLRSEHQKYPKHHLYSNYNPINGEFYQTGNVSNKNVFMNAGNNIFG